MSLEFSKMEGKPSWAKDGVYIVDTESSANTLYSNGLDFTNDLERFSLGNWNSIVKNDKIFPTVHKGLSSNMEQGKPIRLQFAPSYVINSLIPHSMIPDHENYTGEGYATTIRTESFHDIHDLWDDEDSQGNHWPRSLRNKFLKRGDKDEGDDYYEENYELLDHLKINFFDGFG